MLTSSGGSTPEELEQLFEDTLVMRDGVALASLFEAGSTLAAGNERPVHGDQESARRALAFWNDERPYLADPRTVLVTRDLGLIVGEHGVNVVRRDRDGAWRYAIVWQSANDSLERKTP
jgi:hypothetical protein